jgi:hypothetical protein
MYVQYNVTTIQGKWSFDYLKFESKNRTKQIMYEHATKDIPRVKHTDLIEDTPENRITIKELGNSHNINIWFDKEENKIPDDSRWVLGHCSLNFDPKQVVSFQVKHDSGGWSDWCGDYDEDGDWKVISWEELSPKHKTVKDKANESYDN